MHSDLQAQLAFHLTGQKTAAGPQPVDAFELIPGLLARYRDLTALRYDFPLVLTSHDGGIVPLSRLVDEALANESERARKQALRREREIRAMLAGGAGGLLSKLWNVPIALAADGELADCDARLPARFVGHAWRAIQERKARPLRERIERLIARLSDILAVDFARSDEGRSAQRLRASFGAAYEQSFDFEAMSRLLARALPAHPLPERRRRRIESLLQRLRSQQFGPFVFDSCAAALSAYRERLPELVALSKAIAAARLEADGEYVEDRHDAFFEGCGDGLLAAEGLSEFPGYLVRLNGAELGMPQNAQLAEMLASAMPVKALVQFDDILDRSPVGGRPGFGLRSRALAGMALGLAEVYVLQCCAADLYQLRDRVLKGLESPGAALFSVFSGASGESGELAPYLVAAAASESRAFPAFSYDPAAEGGALFSLAGNPQPQLDWPLRELAYEDAGHQRVLEEVAFTLADFVACDGRYAGWFARVPKERCNGGMIPVRESVTAQPSGRPETVPYILMADGHDVLHKVIVAEEPIGETRRSLDFWRSLQERQHVRETPAAPVAEPAKPVAAAAAPAVTEPEKQPPSDAPSIETARCTSCDECTRINSRMFAYDANKQAYIADVEAGSYRELVEAAESCQVSIIHPGKPRNPAEPGLDELIKRADPFL